MIEFNHALFQEYNALEDLRWLSKVPPTQGKLKLLFASRYIGLKKCNKLQKCGIYELINLHSVIQDINRRKANVIQNFTDDQGITFRGPEIYDEIRSQYMRYFFQSKIVRW